MSRRMIAPTDDEVKELRAALRAVPQRTIVQRAWRTDEGRKFLAMVRDMQMRDVSTRGIATALGIDWRGLDNAVTYWERYTKARRRYASNKRLVRKQEK